jgi:hypothetical protein
VEKRIVLHAITSSPSITYDLIEEMFRVQINDAMPRVMEGEVLERYLYKLVLLEDCEDLELPLR